MSKKVIFLEGIKGPFHDAFQRLMELVPIQDRNDKNLQRLIAFRSKNDGEDLTRTYILQKINHAKECNYTGSLYDFLKDDQLDTSCGFEDPEPPDEIG